MLPATRPDFPLLDGDKRFLAAKDQWRHGATDLGYPRATSDAGNAAKHALATLLEAHYDAAKPGSGKLPRLLRRSLPTAVWLVSLFVAMGLMPLWLVWLLATQP